MGNNELVDNNGLDEKCTSVDNYQKLYIFATIVELFGIILLSIGIVYEIISKADLGYVIISAGSTLIAAGSLLFAKVAPWFRGDYR